MTSRAKPSPIPVDQLRELLSYDASTGELAWKPRDLAAFRSEAAGRAWNAKYAGRPAGTIKSKSAGLKYLQVNVGGGLYMAHRLCWLMHHGAIDESMQIDHINGDGTDNRIENLRLVTASENLRNQAIRRDNRSGAPGVYWCSRESKWHAWIKIGGKRKSLGYHKSKAEAVRLRKSAETAHQFHPNHGKSRMARLLSA